MTFVIMHLFFCWQVSFFARNNVECDALMVKKILSKSTDNDTGRITTDYGRASK